MLEVVRSGGQIHIVDCGRHDLRQYGIPESGAMDVQSAMRANSLLHNPVCSATLEISMPGHELRFHQSCIISLAGADGAFLINDQKVYGDATYEINEGSTLHIGRLHKGCRLYLGIKGGFQTTEMLGSRSPIPGFFNRVIVTGDKIPLSNITQFTSTSNTKPLKIILNQSIQCFMGPEWYLLEPSVQSQILQEKYTIHINSNRMGYQLDGEKIQVPDFSLFSSAVFPGTVQLLPSGRLVVLMRDCQTTGGYMRILQVHPADINQVAQRRPGQRIQFQLID